MNENKKINLFTFYSPDYVSLKRRFERSLKDSYIVHFIPFENDGKRTGTGGGIQTWIFKTEKIIEAIKKHRGEIVIFSDIDVQFFGKTETFVKQVMKDFDIVFQGEHKFTKVNIGFIVFNSNERVLNLWYQVLKKVKDENLWDQDAVNSLLVDSRDLKWGFLPSSFWNWYMSPCWRDIVLHHAIGTGNMKIKLLQMRIVSFVYHLKFLNKFDTTYKISRLLYRKCMKHIKKLEYEKSTITQN